MIKINEKVVELNKFPDKTFLIKERVEGNKVTLTWLFEGNEELVALIFLAKHIKSKGVKEIELYMPYIPNARQDRVKQDEDVFTLKYFAQVINSLGFSRVTVLDPHSTVSEALIDNVNIITPKNYIDKVVDMIGNDNLMMFYPDEGAMKRYSSLREGKFTFGIKKRDWVTGEINGLDVAGMTEFIPGSRILIVDDICSKGGTFYHSARKLKELGAEEIYLYISHCEKSIMEGEVLTSGLIEKVFTTNSIFTEEHEKIEVFELC